MFRLIFFGGTVIINFMNINIDKNTLAQINCIKIAQNNKPSLFAESVNNDKTLVVVVDMINGFAKKGALASPRVDAIIKPLEKALSMLPDAKKAFVRDEHSDSSVEMKWFPPHCITKKESALVSELEKFKHVDVPKNSTNGLFSLLAAFPDLKEFSNVVIMGCCTDICILQLALSLRAYFNDFDMPTAVTVLIDYVETYDSPMHPADISNLFSLKLMEDAGVQLFKNLV